MIGEFVAQREAAERRLGEIRAEASALAARLSAAAAAIGETATEREAAGVAGRLSRLQDARRRGGALEDELPTLDKLAERIAEMARLTRVIRDYCQVIDALDMLGHYAEMKANQEKDGRYRIVAMLRVLE